MTEPMLSAQERTAYQQLFQAADKQHKSYLFKNEAIDFFSNTGIPSVLLEEIWQAVDETNKGYITQHEFYMALKWIACAQHGIEASSNIFATQVPLPLFKTFIPSLTVNERACFIRLFESHHPFNGLLSSQQAKDIFMQSGLDMDTLNTIWSLADTRHVGHLNKTEFIIAMHYISQLKKDPTLILPTILPAQIYAEATGHFTSSIKRHSTYTSPTSSYTSLSPSLTPVLHNSSHTMHVSPEEKARYQTYFDQLDTDQNGYIESDEAVYFFHHSGLPDSDLAMIWEIADKRHLGKLDVDDFCVAMHLIHKRKRGENIPSLLEQELVTLKQQVEHESNRLKDILYQQQLESKAIQQLQTDMDQVKQELNTVKQQVEIAQHQLDMADRPNLALTPALSFASTVMSPRSEIDSLAGLNKKPTKAFDLAAFDTLSIKHTPSSSIQEDLASLFNTSSDFDHILLQQ